MIIRHFEVKTPQTQPPHDEGWQPTWHGYYEMAKCVSPERRAEWVERDRATRAEGMVTETEFEQDCFLSMLADIKGKQVNMFELGAGWGRMCLALAGVIDHRVIPLTPVSYRCLAVEGEPTHYQWLKEHFVTQKLSGITVYGAVSGKSGTCHFATGQEPDSQYGQTMTPVFNRYRIPSIGGLLYILTKKTAKVPVYTIDQLIKAYAFNHVDIVDMDVQGAEYEVALGAAESIKNDLIDYWLIGTHDRKLNDALRDLLSPKFDLIVDIYPRSVGKVNGFAPIKVEDGIQLYRRKDM